MMLPSKNWLHSTTAHKSVIPKTTTGMQRQQEIHDTDNLLVVHKPYAEKKIYHLHTKRRLSVSLNSFKRDIYIFDADIKERYTNRQIVMIMKLIFKKAAERIIKRLWRMPFPNGVGSLYMKEAQRSNHGLSTEGKIVTDTQIENILREVQLGMRKVFLKWNKSARNFPYKGTWRVSMSQGFFRSLKFNEIIDRAEDSRKQNYRGHII